MDIALLFGLFFALLLLGVPVAYALATAAVATVLWLDLPGSRAAALLAGGTA